MIAHATPEDLALRGGEWVVGRHGIRHWVPAHSAAHAPESFDEPIVEMNAAGMNDVRIANTLGISDDAVFATRKALGIPAVRRPDVSVPDDLPATNTPQGREEAVSRLSADGMTCEQMAAVVGVSSRTIGRIRKRLGIRDENVSGAVA